MSTARADDLVGRAPGPVLAIAASCRTIGAAFLDGSAPVLTRRRLRRRGRGLEGVELWLQRLLAERSPFVVAIVVDRGRQERFPRYDLLVGLIRRKVSDANISSLELDRDRIAVTLGSRSRSDTSICRDVLAAVPGLASYVRISARVRSDSEREWAPSLIAAAAGLTAVQLLTGTVNLHLSSTST